MAGEEIILKQARHEYETLKEHNIDEFSSKLILFTESEAIYIRTLNRLCTKIVRIFTIAAVILFLQAASDLFFTTAFRQTNPKVLELFLKHYVETDKEAKTVKDLVVDNDGNMPDDTFTPEIAERQATFQVAEWLLELIPPAVLETMYGIAAWKRRKEAEAARDKYVRTGKQMNLAKLIQDSLNDVELGDDTDQLNKYIEKQEQRLVRKRNREHNHLRKITKSQRRRLNRNAGNKAKRQQQQNQQQQQQVPRPSPAFVNYTPTGRQVITPISVARTHTSQNAPAPTTNNNLQLPPLPPPVPMPPPLPPPPPPIYPSPAIRTTNAPFHSNRVRYPPGVSNRIASVYNPYSKARNQVYATNSMRTPLRNNQSNQNVRPAHANARGRTNENLSTNRRIRF